MYSRAQEKRLKDEAPPEILRVPLENLYPQIMAMELVTATQEPSYPARSNRRLPKLSTQHHAHYALARSLAVLILPMLYLPPKLDAKSEAKLNKWKDAKKARDYGLADKLRAELKAEGIDADMAVKSIAAAAAAAAAGDAATPPPPAASKEELTPLASTSHACH